MTAPKKITVTTARCECSMCPTIISGKTEEGWTVYARYRWGLLNVRLDQRDPPPQGGAAGERLLEKQLDPEKIDGCISYEDLRKITAGIIEWPVEISPGSFDESDTWLEL